MSTSNDSSTTFRYFLAGLKPLRKATFWIPIGILALVGLGLWQYRNQTNQANQISPFPLGDKKLPSDAQLLPGTQWIWKEPTENTNTFTLNKNNRIPENVFSSDPTIAPSGSKSRGKISSDGIVNSLVSDLNPLDADPSQSGKNNVQDILRQNNRSSTLFAPLLPNRANQNSARSSGFVPEDDPRANNYRVIFPRGFITPTQTESPLERAVNREAASASQNSTISRGQSQSQSQGQGQGQGQGQIAPSQPSLYYNSYQPPTYQSPGTGANSAGGNSYGGNPNNNATANAPAQPPAPGGGGGFQSGF